MIATLDLCIIVLFFVITLGIGMWMTRGVSKSKVGFFLSDRDLPWWLLGVSMVATTFSADTPNLVTDIVRKQGVAGNWQWWAFLLTGMLTVFVYARLWRRSGIDTDIAFYELRYSGPVARFLRGFRAIYLGVFFNVVIMATVLLAGIKIAGVMLGLSALQTVLLVSIVTVAYSGIGGFKGVVFTDFFQFILSMIGLILAAIYIVNLPSVGGMTGMLAHANVIDKTSFLPDFSDKDSLYILFVLPIAIQWWNVWYPGAEPGGGGYVAQRMLSAKDEDNAVTATLLFNIAHYALRPWPWILIALASLIVYPDLASLQSAFPDIETQFLADDLAFSAMLTKLPTGLFGLVVASLIAALMSTISTHLNWGASYVVSDVYERFVDPDLSGEKAVWLGRLTTMILMILAAIVALQLQSALEAFQLLLQIGAGTGLLFILRWFWWRINGYSEITAMVVSFVVAIVFAKVSTFGMSPSEQLVAGILITTFSWVVVTFMTPPTDPQVLRQFYQKIKPHSTGWGPVAAQVDVAADSYSSLGREIGMMILGCFAVYAALFGIGYILYSQWVFAIVSITVAVVCFVTIANLWRRKS